MDLVGLAHPVRNHLDTMLSAYNAGGCRWDVGIICKIFEDTLEDVGKARGGLRRRGLAVSRSWTEM